MHKCPIILGLVQLFTQKATGKDLNKMVGVNGIGSGSLLYLGSGID